MAQNLERSLRRTRARWGWQTAALLLVASAVFGALSLWLNGLPFIALLIALVVALVTWLRGHSGELAAVNARPAEASHPDVVEMLAVLAGRAGIAMPAVYVAPQALPNAFAVRTRAGGAVCVFQGALDLLSERELRAVLAHEVGHLRNNDSAFSILTRALTDSVLYVFAAIGVLIAFVLLLVSRSKSGEVGSVVLGGLVWAVGFVVSGLLLHGVVRQREYLADEESVSLNDDPGALASALRRLDAGVAANPLRTDRSSAALAQVCVVAPMGAGLGRLFATHPSTERRIRRLQRRLRLEVR